MSTREICMYTLNHIYIYTFVQHRRVTARYQGARSYARGVVRAGGQRCTRALRCVEALAPTCTNTYIHIRVLVYTFRVLNGILQHALPPIHTPIIFHINTRNSPQRFRSTKLFEFVMQCLHFNAIGWDEDCQVGGIEFDGSARASKCNC